MSRITVGIASSVSKDLNYDAFDTLDFCKRHRIEIAQIYLNLALKDNPSQQTKLAQRAKNFGIELWIHYPLLLNEEAADPAFLNAANTLLALQQSKPLVIHHDGSQRPEVSVAVAAALSRSGLEPFIENFYPEAHSTDVKTTITRYTELFTLALAQGLKPHPVLDFPRFFAPHVEATVNGLGAACNTMAALAALNLPCAVHLIDYATDDQNRDQWLPVGQGLLPFQEIEACARRINLSLNPFIIELEDKQHAIDSIAYLQRHFSL